MAEEVHVDSNIIVANIDKKAGDGKKRGCPTTGKERLKHSNFYVTINTNKQFDAHEEGLRPFVNQFKQVVNEIFGGENIKNYMKIKEPEHDFSTDYFHSISSKAVIECGEKNRTIHCHAFVKVAHWYPVSLDYDKIHAKVVNAMGLGNIHMKMSLYCNAGDTLASYLYKDVEGAVAEPLKITLNN